MNFLLRSFDVLEQFADILIDIAMDLIYVLLNLI